METFKKKSLVLKIVIAIVVVILFNFSAPTMSRAENVAEVVGGTLAEPVADLLLAIGDGVVYVVQNVLFGMDVSLLKMAVPTAGIWETVGTIGGAILGALSTALIVVATGGTAIPALIIPAIVGGGIGAYAGHGVAVELLPDSFYLPIYAISPEEIFQNNIGLLDVNFFNPNEYEDITTEDGQTITQESTASKLQATISSWYLTLRNFAIVVLLVVLLYIGIKIVTSSASQDRAKYKEKLFSWVVALCLLFFMHYIMSFATTMVEAITEGINTINKPILLTLSLDEIKDRDYKIEVVGEDGERGGVSAADYFEEAGIVVDSTVYWPTNLMGVVRLDMQMDNGVTEENQILRRLGYTVLFLILVFYTVAFLIIYLRRLIMLAFLTMIAPLVAMTYPIDKMNDGNAQAFNMWLKEYVFNLLIQPFHLILYTMLVGSALDFATENILYAVVAMGFLFQAEKLLRKFFGFDKAGTLDTNGSTLAGMVGMAGINALRRIGGVGKGGGKSRNGSSSENGGNTGRVRQADRGRSARDLLNARQGNAGTQPSLASQNIPANDDQNDVQTPMQRMLEADEENNNWGDSQERDTFARSTYQPASPNYTAQQYADVLRNVGYDDDTINEIIRTDPRYANDFNQPQPSAPQPGQQQPPTIRQHIDQSAQPDPNNLNPDHPLPPTEPNEPLTLGQRLDNNFLKTSEDDTRGMGQWLADGVSKTWNESQLKNTLQASPVARMGRQVGAGAKKIKDIANKNIVEPTQKFVKGMPKPVRNTIRGAATVAGKAAAYAVPRAGKLYAKAALGATAGLVGVAAGLATSDDRNILSYGGTGLAAGLAAGTAGTNIASNASRGIQNVGEKAVSTYTTAAKGADAEKARIQAKEDKAAMKDKARQEKYMNKLEVPKSEMKRVMEDYQKYRQSGITDDDIIIGAMKADEDKFGRGRANDERILLAAIANETGRDNKKIKEYGERLKELGLSDNDVKKFTDEVRSIHKLI